MRKITYAALFLLLAAAAGFGQAPAVLLQNQDVATFYYVVDPKGLEGVSPGSPLLASRIAGFFSAAGDGTFASIAPDGKARLTDLSAGTHLLVGFFAVDEEDEFPVRVVSLQVDTSIGDRFYALFASPAQLTVPRGVGKLAGFAREGATAVAEASSPSGTAAPQEGTAAQAGSAAGTSYAPSAESRAPLETIKDFTGAFDPGTFTREKAGEFAVLPVSQSRAWDMTGTRIASLSGARDPEGVRLSLAVPGGFSPSVSYFLYVFTGRTLGQENALTLELVPRACGSQGACLLWRKGEAHPRMIGRLATTGTDMTVDISAEELQQVILAGAEGGGTDVTFDLTAGWHDASLALWEEFFYASFSLSRITVTR